MNPTERDCVPPTVCQDNISTDICQQSGKFVGLKNGLGADPLRPPHGTRAQVALVAHGGDATTTIRYRVQTEVQLTAMLRLLWPLRGCNEGQKGAISAFAYWGLQTPPPFHHQAEGPADNTGLLINQGANCSTTMAASPPWAFVPFALARAGAITLWGHRQVPLSVGQTLATHLLQPQD